MSQPAVLHPLAAFILTRRIPCAALLLALLGAVVWLPALSKGLPLLALLASAVGIGLHVLAPSLVALITFGGGASFALHVTGIVSLAVVAIAGFDLLPGLVVLVVYGLLTIMSAGSLRGTDGVKRSAVIVAIGMGVAVFAALVVGSTVQGMGLHAYAAHLVAPLFDNVQLPADEPGAAEVLQRTRDMTALILPGIVAIGLWMAWWGDVMLARNVAKRYGFYDGNEASALNLEFGKPLAYAFMAMLVMANFAGGDVRFVGVNAAILFGGLLAAQGVAVAHSWLRAKGFILAISLMYLMLIMWSAMIFPFVIVGLLDIWFKYRRNLTPASGG